MDIGGAGEDFFSGLCKAAGIIPNRSFECDANGWDHYVEFKAEGAILSEPLFEAKIQVKSSFDAKNSRQVDLQNLLKLSTYRYPSFIVYLKFLKGNPTPHAVYVKHIDEDLIKKVFQQVSKVRASKGKVNLRKHKMSVHFLEEERIETTSGLGLKNRFEFLVESKIDEYIQNKSLLLKRLDQEHNTTNINFKIIDMDIEAVQNAFLGFGEPISVNDLSLVEMELGAMASEPKITPEGAKLIALPVGNEKAVLTFSGSVLSPSVTFECTFISSPINALVPKENIKIRFENEFFNILMKPNTCQMTIHFDFLEDKVSDIDELYKALYLAHNLGNAGVLNRLSIRLNEIPIEIGLPSSELNFNFENDLTCLDGLRDIKNNVKDFDKKIELSLGQLWGVRERVDFIKKLLQQKIYMRLEFSCEQLESSLPVASIMLVSLSLESVCYCYVVAIVGEKHELDDGRYQVNTNNVTFVDNFIVRNKTLTQDELSPLLDDYEKGYYETHSVVRQESFII